MHPKSRVFHVVLSVTRTRDSLSEAWVYPTLATTLEEAEQKARDEALRAGNWSAYVFPRSRA